MQQNEERVADKFDSLFALAKSVTELPSVSGHENMAFDGLEAICGSMFDEIRKNPVGSFTGIKRCGKPNAKKLLFDAHLDEIGFMVTEIGEGGFVKFTNIGGIDTRILSASEIWIYGFEKTIPAVFCAVPPHLKKEGDDKKKLLLSKMWADTGYTKEQLEKYIRIGDPAGFKVTAERLQNNLIVGKAFDDKICVTTILRALQMLENDELDVDIYAQFSGGEEVGYIGGKTATFDNAPDYAVVLDVSNAYIPKAPDYRKNVRVGGGGSVSFSGTTSRSFTKMFISVIEEAKIPHQTAAEPGYTGTNSTAVYISRDGVPMALISVPLKSMHTPSEVISLEDVENTALALAALARKL